MKVTIGTQDKDKDHRSDRELTEERFLEQFAALEESLAFLHAEMHRMSENAKLFDSMARQIRRSMCPATIDHQDKVHADCCQCHC